MLTSSSMHQDPDLDKNVPRYVPQRKALHTVLIQSFYSISLHFTDCFIGQKNESFLSEFIFIICFLKIPFFFSSDENCAIILLCLLFYLFTIMKKNSFSYFLIIFHSPLFLSFLHLILTSLPYSIIIIIMYVRTRYLSMRQAGKGVILEVASQDLKKKIEKILKAEQVARTSVSTYRSVFLFLFSFLFLFCT